MGTRRSAVQCAAVVLYESMHYGRKSCGSPAHDDPIIDYFAASASAAARRIRASITSHEASSPSIATGSDGGR